VILEDLFSELKSIHEVLLLKQTIDMVLQLTKLIQFYIYEIALYVFLFQLKSLGVGYQVFFIFIQDSIDIRGIDLGESVYVPLVLCGHNLHGVVIIHLLILTHLDVLRLAHRVVVHGVNKGI
jgi:hypothetical protein